MEPRGERAQGGDRPGAARDLALQLGEHVPGFEVRERDLELSPAPALGLGGRAARRADLLGVDGEGRIVLVLRRSGTDDECALAAIDALAWGREHRRDCARRVRADDALEVRVVLVVDGLAPRIRAALAALRGEHLIVLETFELRGEGAPEVRLERVPLAAGAERGRERPSAAPRGLDTAARALAEQAAAALGRIDPAGEMESAGEVVVWRAPRAGPCTLGARSGHLFGRAGATGLLIACSRDVERFLDLALRTCAPLDRSPPRAPPAPDTESEVRRRTSPLLPRGPLLTADEMAMLRGEAAGPAP